MINFILPGFYSHFNINKKLLLLYQKYPEWFIDNINFTSFYDSFPYMIFEGSRNFKQYQQIKQDNILEILDLFNNQYNIPIRLVCTNQFITSKQFNDMFSNTVLSLCENDMNEILISNNLLLENYLKQSYPKYSFISSTTKDLKNIQNTIQELQNYKQVCINYKFNNNFILLEKIPLNLRNKCEFLCNEVCVNNCQYRSLHYQEISKSILGYRNDNFNCPYYNQKYNIMHPIITQQQHNINISQIINNYIPLSFINFKLAGRQFSDLELILTYSSYLIKQKYKNTFILEMSK